MFDFDASLSASATVGVDLSGAAQISSASSASPPSPAETSDPHASCRFYLAIDGIPQAAFTEVGGLSMELSVEEVEEGGNNDFVHRLPGRCKLGTLSLKRGVTNSPKFFNWILEIAQGTITRRHLSLILFQANGEELARWDLLNAYPIKWSGPQLSASSASISIEAIDFAHEGMKVG